MSDFKYPVMDENQIIAEQTLEISRLTPNPRPKESK
jgi:hypothetical protein